jgi:tetratricopeptide (TPR) repeat protein
LEIAREMENRDLEKDLLENIGTAYFYLDDLKKKIEYYEKILKINPDDANVYYEKACIRSLMDKKMKLLNV